MSLRSPPCQVAPGYLHLPACPGVPSVYTVHAWPMVWAHGARPPRVLQASGWPASGAPLAAEARAGVSLSGNHG